MKASPSNEQLADLCPQSPGMSHKPRSETPPAELAPSIRDSEKILKVKAYLARLCAEPGATVADLLHENFEQMDLASPTSPANNRRNAAQLARDGRAASSWLQWQDIQVVSLVEIADRVVARVRWRGKTHPRSSCNDPGFVLASDLGVIFDFSDGMIISQRNYDWQRFAASRVMLMQESTT